MYFLDELTKEHQNELLREAELARSVNQGEDKKAKVQARLRNALGDLLINGGLKLKGQHSPIHRPPPV